MVGHVAPTSKSNSLLLPQDVLTAIDDVPVANDGKIPFRHGERVSLQCYVQTKFPGDTVRCSLLRRPSTDSDAVVPPEEIQVEVPVTPSVRPVPAHHNNDRPPYLVVSGLVFTELSAPLLEEWGAWDEYVSANVSYLVALEAKGYGEREGDRIVVLSQVLAHRENLGYDQYGAMHLEEVDGVEVRNLRHLKSLLEEGGGKDGKKKGDGFVRFGFAPDGTQVVLERRRMEEVTTEVCQEQSITKRFYFPRTDRDDKDDNEGEEERKEE